MPILYSLVARGTCLLAEHRCAMCDVYKIWHELLFWDIYCLIRRCSYEQSRTSWKRDCPHPIMRLWSRTPTFYQTMHTHRDTCVVSAQLHALWSCNNLENEFLMRVLIFGDCVSCRCSSATDGNASEVAANILAKTASVDRCVIGTCLFKRGVCTLRFRLFKFLLWSLV
jgi:hypothetical protein